jgi:hypothetical protein
MAVAIAGGAAGDAVANSSADTNNIGGVKRRPMEKVCPETPALGLRQRALRTDGANALCYVRIPL